jgi:hypothetical protein
MPLAVTPEKLTARFVVNPQVPETESTWLISERLEAATSVVGLKLAPPQLIQIEPGQGWYSKPITVLRCPQQPRVTGVTIHCLKKYRKARVQSFKFPRIRGHIYFFLEFASDVFQNS